MHSTVSMLVSGLRQLHLVNFVIILLMLSSGLVMSRFESVSVQSKLGLSKVLPLFVMHSGQYMVFWVRVSIQESVYNATWSVHGCFLDKSVLREALLSDVSPLLNP